MAFKVIKNSQSIIKRLKTSHFVRNVAMVGGGIAAAHAITLAFMPFITRLYGPEAFGIAAAFTAIVNIVMPLATMGYANAIIMPESDEHAAAVARLSILFGLIIVPVSLIAVYFGKPWLAAWTGMETAPNTLYFIPLILLVSAFLSVAEQSAIRANLFKEKARAYVESTLLTNIGKLIGGVLVPSGLLLIILTLVGKIINFMMQMLRVPRVGILKISRWFGWDGIKVAAVTQRDFAIYRMPQSILKAASNGLPTIFLASMFSVGAAGQYSLAVMTLGAPSMLIGKAVGEVFYPKITRSITNKSIRSSSLLLKTTSVLFVVAAIPFGMIALWGDYLIPWVFGLQWELAGSYSQWIALWLIANLMADASIATLPALGLQRLLLISEVVAVCMRVSAFYIGFYIFDSDVVAVALFSIVNMMISLFIIFFSYKYLIVKCKKWHVNYIQQ